LNKITVPWTCDSQDKFLEAIGKGFRYFLLFVVPIIYFGAGWHYGVFENMNDIIPYLVISMIFVGMPWAMQFAYWFSENEFPFQCKCEEENE